MLADHRYQPGRAVLFHVDRGNKRIESTTFQQPGMQMTQIFRCDVINVGFDDRDLILLITGNSPANQDSLSQHLQDE